MADVRASIFGHTMLDNCDQAGTIVRNVSNDATGKAASYEDLSKFTLVNYNAGPGCLGDAIQATRDNNQAYEWPNVAANLEGACTLGSEYVDDMSN